MTSKWQGPHGLTSRPADRNSQHSDNYETSNMGTVEVPVDMRHLQVIAGTIEVRSLPTVEARECVAENQLRPYSGVTVGKLVVLAVMALATTFSLFSVITLLQLFR